MHIPEGSTLWRVGGLPSQQWQICSWWHFSVLFCKWDQYVELLYTCTCNPGWSVSCPFQQDPVFSYGLLGSDALSAKLHGVTSQDCNLDTDHLEKFHTNTFDLTPAPAISHSNRIACSMVVFISTHITAGNVIFFVCLMTWPVHFHNASVSVS